MKVLKNIFFVMLTTMGFGLTACSDNDNPQVVDEPSPEGLVTLLTDVNGLGDNGYNDDAAAGVFAFCEQTGIPMRMLSPHNMAEAETMFRRWLAENSTGNGAVLILGSSAYEEMAASVSAAEREKLSELSRNGGGVLLFESEKAIAGVSSVKICRYGASYLAGAMTGDFDVLIFAAAPGFASLEESITGFRDGHKSHRGELYGDSCDVTLRYLADGGEGFTMADSAYHVMSGIISEDFMWQKVVFPLLGGSTIGVARSINDDEFTAAMMIGMDVDQAGQCHRTPFSMVIRIGDVVKAYLDDLYAGREWPATKMLGMSDGAADIVVNNHFGDDLIIWDDRYDDPMTFVNRYQEYKREAIDYEKGKTDNNN